MIFQEFFKKFVQAICSKIWDTEKLIALFDSDKKLHEIYIGISLFFINRIYIHIIKTNWVKKKSCNAWILCISSAKSNGAIDFFVFRLFKRIAWMNDV